MTVANGTDIVPALTNGTGGAETGTSSNEAQAGISPNDGYGIQGVRRVSLNV